MTNRLAFFLSFLYALFFVSSGLPVAWAQVSTNLDALPAASPHSSRHTLTKHAQNPVAHPQNNVATATQAPAKPPPAPTPAGYSRSLDVPPQAPAPTIITPPPFPVTLHPPVPAAVVVPISTSHSHAEPLPDDGLRVIFDANNTDLNQETIEAVRHYAQSMVPKLEVRFILRSYASLPGSDISMPRRIALSRALAIRGLLVQSGVATTRIYPIAQGRPDATDTAPTERLDILPERNPPPVDTSLSTDHPSEEKVPTP